MLSQQVDNRLLGSYPKQVNAGWATNLPELEKGAARAPPRVTHFSLQLSFVAGLAAIQAKSSESERIGAFQATYVSRKS